MNCQNKINYKGGPNENLTNSCFAKAINTFLGFPFMLVCGESPNYVYCNWANKMNFVLKIFKNSLIISAHKRPSIFATTFLVVLNDKGLIYFAALPNDYFFSNSNYLTTCAQSYAFS